MLLICSSCATRLQLDDAKIPAHSFTIKCPKCRTPLNSPAPVAAAPTTITTLQEPVAPAAAAMNDSALDVSAAPRFETPNPAPVFELKEDMNNHVSQRGDDDASAAAPSETSELTRVLAALLQRGAAQPTDKQRNASRLVWERRRALVCVADAGAQRETVARALAQNDYQTFVAEDVTQALERMREERMDVVLLDKDFDPLEQGAAFVTREVNALRPVERRRLFFVSLNAAARTGDAHAAFISNVNLVVNPADIENLPRALERAVRDYNDLYSDFNSALNVAAL